VSTGGVGTTVIFDNADSGSAFGSSTWNHTTVSGATGIIVILAVYIPGGTPPAVTYDGSSMLRDTSSVTWTANPMALYVYSLPSPASGTKVVSVTINGGAGFVGTSVSVTGGSIAPVIRAGSILSATGTSNAPTTTCNTAINDLVVSHVNNGAGGGAVSYTATTGIEREDLSLGGASSACSTKTAGSASEAMSWTVDGGGTPNWGIIAAAFQHG
jgi:hypothetical protein